MEVSLVIGIVACGSSACPAPSADLGEILFIGKYQSQGQLGNTLNTFENFTFVVPSDISGKASIQVQHVFLLTPPVSVLRINGSGCLFGLLRRDTRSLALSTPVSAFKSLRARALASTFTQTAITRNAWAFLEERTQMVLLLICMLLLPSTRPELTVSLVSIVTGRPPKSGNGTLTP